MFNKVSEFVQEALYRKSAGQTASQAVIWGSFNSVLLTILFYDLKYGGYTQENKILWWCAFLLSIICILNIFVHLKSYFLPVFIITPLEVNEKQRKLLSISDSDVGFKSPSSTSDTSAPTPERLPKLSELVESTLRTTNTSQPLNSTIATSPYKSWFQSSSQDIIGSPHFSFYSNSSLSPASFNMNQSQMISNVSPSVTANSWSFHRNRSSLLDSSYNILPSPKHDVFNASQLSNSFFGKASPQSFSPSLSNVTQPFTSSPVLLGGRGDALMTKEELEKYLQEFREKEIRKQILSQSENSNGGGNSLWAYGGASSSNFDLINSLKQNLYQPAVKDAGTEANSSLSKSDDPKMPYYSSSSVSKIWLKRNVTPKILFKFEENLRIWLAMNILQPLVQLIDSCNEALTAVAPELKIGNVGVDKLKKTAQNISGIKQLNYLLPFLDVTVHQDYLVQRLRELSKGGAISAFQWNAGGSFSGNPWRDEYPTDTFILLHLFSMYMDSHLPPDPTQPDGRVFSNLHVVKTPEKPSLPTTNPCLYLAQINPPHLKVILPPEEECEVGVGHKNCFHALILFCHHLVHQQHSHIAGVNLKLSGINLAWVVNAE